MSSLPFSFYNIVKPNLNETVLVIFTKHSDSIIEGKLIEYNCDLVMKYSDATKKRKVTSWNKIVPLNKIMVAKVDDPNYDKTIVQVSLDKDDKDNLEILDLFYKNKQLISIMKKIIFEQNKETDNDEKNNDEKEALLILNNTNLENFWNVIYIIDEKRREEYEPEDLPILLDYILEETDLVSDTFNENDYSHFYPRFNQLIKKINQNKNKKILSKIEIVSTGSYKNTIILFENALNKIKEKIEKKIKKEFDFNYSLKYESASVYIFETFPSKTIDDIEDDEIETYQLTYQDHNDFVNFVKEEGLKLKPETHVKFESHKIEISV